MSLVNPTFLWETTDTPERVAPGYDHEPLSLKLEVLAQLTVLHERVCWHRERKSEHDPVGAMNIITEFLFHF